MAASANNMLNEHKQAKEAFGVVEQRSEKTLSSMERLLLSAKLQNIILSFDNNKVGEKKFNAIFKSYKPKDKEERKITLCSNMNVLFADQLTARIAHNLLWQIDVEETLVLAAQHPESLLNVVEIKDPHGQRIRGTPLQIMKAAGDRNPKEMKPEEKPYGLVERLRPCFKNPKDYDDQLNVWDISKEASEKTMGPYRQAIETFCHDIIASKDISSKVPFKTLFDLPIVLKFRHSLKPDPNNIVTSGFLFDVQIFLDFISIFESNIVNDNVADKRRPNLEGWSSAKSDLFDAIVYRALQARCERCDVALFKNGIKNVLNGEIPERLDYSNGNPTDLKDIGASHLFGFKGEKYETRWCVRVQSRRHQTRPARQLFTKLVLSKSAVTSLKDESKPVVNRPNR